MPCSARPEGQQWRCGPVDDHTRAQWQKRTDILARLLHVPVALIIRAGDESIEVLVSSPAEGEWQDVAAYIASRSEAESSHSICGGCLKEHYPATARRMGL